MSNRFLIQILPLIGLSLAQVLGAAQSGQSRAVLHPAPCTIGEVPNAIKPQQKDITSSIQVLRSSTDLPSICAAMEKLADAGELALPALIELLRDPSVQVRLNTMQILSLPSLRTNSITPNLLPLLKDPSVRIRSSKFSYSIPAFTS
jgi:HEAT repeat protein